MHRGLSGHAFRVAVGMWGLGLLAGGFAGCAARSSAGDLEVMSGAVSDREFEIGKTTLASLNVRMQAECHNLANVSTPGFKGVRIVQESVAFGPAEAGGVRQSGTVVDMSAGAPVATRRALDIMVSGMGMLRVDLGTSATCVGYTRDGRLTLNRDGEITTLAGGHRVVPAIAATGDWSDIRIAPDGRVFVSRPGAVEPELIGQLMLTKFLAPEFLRPVGGGFFVETAESGAPVDGNPEENDFGTILSGCYEGSNVDPLVTRLSIARIRREREAWIGSMQLPAEGMASADR